MRVHKSVGFGVAMAGLLGMGIFAGALCSPDCPVILTVIGSAPSGVLDDDGNEFQILTVRISNRNSGRLTFAEDGIRAEAMVGGRWSEAKSLSTVLDVGRYRDLLMLAPYNAEGCRLAIDYLPEPLKLRFMRVCASLGMWRLSWWRALAMHCLPVGWLQPLRSDYIGTSPSWKHIRPEVSLESKGSVRPEPNSRRIIVRPGAGLLERGFIGWLEIQQKLLGRHPGTYSFPASPTVACSIHGLLNQCTEVSGVRYVIPKNVAAGSVQFGHTKVLPGPQWVQAFTEALQHGQPQWWDSQAKRSSSENLVLVTNDSTACGANPRFGAFLMVISALA